MDCEFEEKSYEIGMDIELVQNQAFFAPGQVLENAFGIDMAVFTVSPFFWSFWNIGGATTTQQSNGVELKDLWNKFGERIDAADFPEFKCNAFIQYKRPEYLVRRYAKQYDEWGRPYYRVWLEERQLGTLQRLENTISQSGLVTYAAPAFSELPELLRHLRQRQCVQNSNYVRPSVFRIMTSILIHLPALVT